MKRICAFITAVLMLGTAVSCRKESESRAGTAESFTAEQLGDVAYKKSAIEIPSDMKMIYCLEPYNNSSNYLILGSGAQTPAFWTVDSAFTDFKAVDIPEFDIGVQYDIDVLEDGTIVGFLNDVSYGDLPEPDLEAPDYNPAEYEASAEYSYRIKTYSIDGKLLTETDITGFGEDPDGSTQITGIASDGEIIVVLLNGAYQVFGMDGRYIGELSAGDGWAADEIGRDSSGSLICAVTNEEDKMQLRKINTEGKAEESSVTYDFPESIYCEMLPGTGDYSLYIMTFTTIYGVRSSDSSIEPLFSINKAGAVVQNLNGFARAADGEFVLPIVNYSDFSVKMRKYTPCDPSELENLPVITFGIPYAANSWQDKISDYNENIGDYQVEVKFYQEQEEIDEAALSGNLPDVLFMSSADGSFGELNLADKDVLCDLYEFIDNDDTMSRENFIPQILENAEDMFEGHLYTVPRAFYLDIPYAAKTKFVGDIGEWNFDSYLELLENLPEGMGLTEYYKEDIPDTKHNRLRNFYFDNWVDFENAECDFASESFIRFLEYCNKAPMVDVGEDFVYSTPDEKDQREETAKLYRRYIDDLALFYTGGIGTYSNYLIMKEGEFGGEPVKILGTPGLDGSTGVTINGHDYFAINKTSEHKELAWDLVRYFISDEYYGDDINDYSGFPVTYSGLEMMKQNEMKPQNNKGIVGLEDDSYTGYFYFAGYNEDGTDNILLLGGVTEEIADEVDALIAGAEIVKGRSRGNVSFEVMNEFYNMGYEEIDRYFYGECTAEQCADAMQNRLSIFLSEKFG